MIIFGIWLFIRSSDMTRYKNHAKAIGGILITLGILFIISDIFVFTVLTQPEVILSYDADVIDTNLDIEISKIRITFDESDSVTYIIQDSHYSHTTTIRGYYYNNGVTSNFRFYNNVSTTEIVASRYNETIELIFENPVLSEGGEYLGNNIILNSDNERVNVLFEGVDGSIVITFNYQK